MATATTGGAVLVTLNGRSLNSLRAAVWQTLRRHQLRLRATAQGPGTIAFWAEPITSSVTGDTSASPAEQVQEAGSLVGSY